MRDWSVGIGMLLAAAATPLQAQDTGIVVFEGYPEGAATVVVDGMPAFSVAADDVMLQLRVGEYRATISRDGFGSTQTPVHVTANDTIRVHASLRHHTAEELEEGPRYTPMNVRPEIANVPVIVRAMQNVNFPEAVRREGEWRATVWFLVDREGRTEAVQIAEGSGNAGVDRKALEVARLYEFSPALLNGTPTAVWVRFPITFTMR